MYLNLFLLKQYFMRAGQSYDAQKSMPSSIANINSWQSVTGKHQTSGMVYINRQNCYTPGPNFPSGISLDRSSCLLLAIIGPETF